MKRNNMDKITNATTRLLNKSAIARESGYSQTYVSLLLRGKKINKKALTIVQAAIIRLYGNIYDISRVA
jgi:hypothetical protein